ncbi:MAG: outer membrane protein transport protein [Bacteroidales bacterium]|nr:outer membrane protein transport protein [Bacteroidales bacterium]MBK9356325.1 outer membrane protein transport protein [Bacteroidales bacterium]
MRKLTLLSVVCTLWISGVYAGGYQVGLHGQKQIGMGLIGTSLSLDASSMFYNPGGLSFMKPSFSFAAGISPIRSFTIFRKNEPSTYSAMTENPLGTPFYFYGAAKINDRLSAGLAVNTPYGNSLSWGKDWDGRYLIQDLSLRAIFFQPTLSYKVNDWLGIGAGFVFATGKFDLTKALPVTGANGDGSVNLNGSTTAMGYNVGVMIQPTEKLSIGIDYRSEISMEVSGAEAKFTVPSTLAGNFPADNKFSTTLPLPANLDFGLSYNVSEDLMIGLSLNYVFWSVYDSLIFDFETNTPALPDSKNPRLYEDKLIVRLGGEYTINDKFAIRAGGYYDPSPVNEEYFSPETPSLNNLGLTAGLSYKPVEKLSIDLSFLYIMGAEADKQYTPDNFGGTFKSRVYIPGFGLTYNF